jgi:hypothetical protein
MKEVILGPLSVGVPYQSETMIFFQLDENISWLVFGGCSFFYLSKFRLG